MAAEIFLVGAVLVVAVLLGRWLSIRLGVPEAAAYVVLGGLVGLLPGMAEIRATLDAALRELDAAIADAGREPPGADALRQVLELRRDTLRGRTADGSDADTDTQADERELRLRLLEAERRALRELRADGSISGPTAVEISQELDLDEARLRKRA